VKANRCVKIKTILTLLGKSTISGGNEMNKKLKVCLILEMAIVVCFYYAVYDIMLVASGCREPWISFIETSMGFKIFVAVSMFLYASVRLVNFVMSWAKGKTNAFLDYFTDGWFSVHKLFKRQRLAK